MTPQPGLPDLVFTANAGLVFGKRFYSSRFRHEVRARESPHFDAWFAEHGYTVEHLPEGMFFEGAGDALFCGHVADRRLSHSQRRAGPSASRQPLASTGFAVGTGQSLLLPSRYMLLPAGPRRGDLLSRGVRRLWPQQCSQTHIPRLIAADDDEAQRFGCNAVVVGKTVVLNTGCDKLAADLRAAGYTPMEVELDEFLKSAAAPNA